MPLVIYGAAHTGKQISVIFQKKQYPAYDHTITGNFFEKNLISKNSFWDLINLQIFFPVAKFS